MFVSGDFKRLTVDNLLGKYCMASFITRVQARHRRYYTATPTTQPYLLVKLIAYNKETLVKVASKHTNKSGRCSSA